MFLAASPPRPGPQPQPPPARGAPAPRPAGAKPGGPYILYGVIPGMIASRGTYLKLWFPWGLGWLLVLSWQTNRPWGNSGPSQNEVASSPSVMLHPSA